MFIKKLVIYGFGKHRNVSLDLERGVNIVYGMNEAGKTTLQQFILQILFGFPQKNSVLQRYEPKNGHAFGGQLHIEDDTYGSCIIERVAGKSAGNVTVRFEDGTTGGNEALQAILRQYDRTSFESIFSFSLFQLQGLEKMTEDELNRLLLASGTTGVDALLQLEKQMEKEMGELFKKTGRNPVMNVRLQELRQLEKELKEERAKVDSYAQKMKRLNEVDEEIEQLQKAYASLQADSRETAMHLQAMPQLKRMRSIENRLAQLKTTKFPRDGIRRYEMLIGRKEEAEAKKATYLSERQQLEKRLLDKPDRELIDQMASLLSQESEWHNNVALRESLIEEKRQLLNRKHRLLDRIGIREGDSRLSEGDLSIKQEELLHEQLSEVNETERQIGYVKRQLEQSEAEWKSYEREWQENERLSPSPAEEEKVEQWHADRNKYLEAKAYIQLVEQKRRNVLPVLAIGAVAVAAAITGATLQKIMFIVIGVLMAAAALYVHQLQSKNGSDSKKSAEMKRLIATYDGQVEQLDDLFEKIRVYKERKANLELQLRKINQAMQVLDAELIALTDERKRLGQSVNRFFEQYGIQQLPNSGVVQELFRMLREVQEIKRDVEEIDRRIAVLSEKTTMWKKEISSLLPNEVPENLLFNVLRQEYTALVADEAAYSEAVIRFDAIGRKLMEIEQIAASLQQQIRQLFDEANADGETGFYKAHEDYQEYSSLTRQLADMTENKTCQGANKAFEHFTEFELEQKIEDTNNAIATMEEQLHHLQQEKASLAYETDQLLSDDTMQKKRQLFEMKKAEFAELSKRWATVQVVSEGIKRTMDELKEKKLPEVMKTAEQFFKRLTGGAYDTLSISEKGLFQAIDCTGRQFSIYELSQATKEQAYLSLRLSLSMAMEESAPFPIIMDDPFVHFDETRLSSMITIMEERKNAQQFIYFTCHESLKYAWTDAAILNVSELGNEEGMLYDEKNHGAPSWRTGRPLLADQTIDERDHATRKSVHDPYPAR